VGLAVPGFLLSGWTPAVATSRAVQVVVHRGDLPEGDALDLGVRLGMADVARTATLTHAPVLFASAGDDVAPVPGAVVTHVIVAREDDGRDAVDGPCAGPSIYTCPLDEWRPDVWSVASSPDARGADWDPALRRDGAAQLNARFLQQFGTQMDAAAWRGWMAVKIAYESSVRALAGEPDMLALAFEGHKGALLRFTDSGHLRQPTYRVERDGRAVTLPPLPDHDLVDLRD
jgi:hypothetical protein